ncbi:hypothetical protein ANO11243_013190 [Dothideomycetidae sp. 11243]|nr:hypothetical protein ANO11243_013190 [fungal sp. No.11243]
MSLVLPRSRFVSVSAVLRVMITTALIVLNKLRSLGEKNLVSPPQARSSGRKIAWRNIRQPTGADGAEKRRSDTVFAMWSLFEHEKERHGDEAATAAAAAVDREGIEGKMCSVSYWRQK